MATAKRSVFAWCFYQCAGAAFPTIILSFVFGPYFTQFVAKKTTIGAAQWGYATVLAGLIFAVFSLVGGTLADLDGRRKPWILFFTLLVMLSSFALWYSQPNPAYVVWTLFWLVIGIISINMANVFYDSMLSRLVPWNKIGKISGVARALGYIGSLGSLLIVLFAIIQPSTAWLFHGFSATERVRACCVFVGAWSGLFALPLLIWTPDLPSTGIKLQDALKRSVTTLLETYRQLNSYHSLFWFIIASTIFTSGINILSIFGGIYISTVFHLNTAMVIRFGLMMSVTAAMGALLFGWIDHYLSTKISLFIALLMISFSIIMMLFISSLYWLWLVIFVGSLFMGVISAANRSMLARLTPQYQMAQVFSFTALLYKTTGFIGPWLASSFILIFANEKIGLIMILIFLLLGALCLLKMKNPKEVDDLNNINETIGKLAYVVANKT